MLRNTAVVNLFDGCALSVPCHLPGTAPVGLMIAGTQNTDRKILAIGLAAAPRSINHKRGIRQQITRSMISFMESIV
jgi:aspartyl-tRNA(Asn)/glutamyl-tRNA(Gln) amidotransferase subunit A